MHHVLAEVQTTEICEMIQALNVGDCIAFEIKCLQPSVGLVKAQNKLQTRL